MAYADLLDEEGINSQYLCVLRPRRLADTGSWSLVSATIYKQGFDYGYASAVTDDGTALTQASSAALSDGDWYFDFDAMEIYIDVSADPSTHDIVITYELYLGTFDAHFNRDPLDSASQVVYWEPIIVKSPLVQNTAEDSLFGFISTLSSQIRISNATQYLQRHIYDSSFNRADIALYHYLDELTADNVKLVSKGLCGNIQASDDEIGITVRDNYELFDREFRHTAGESFFGTTAFPNVDPSFDARTVRTVFGRVERFLPVNIDYEGATPTTSTNRIWICVNPETNLGSITASVPASPSSTTSRVYVDDADGFNVGDTIFIDKTVDESVTVTAVNKTGDHYLDHTGHVSAAPGSGDSVQRSFVGNITIVQNNTVYKPLFGRDYFEYTDGTNKVAGFRFADPGDPAGDMETSLGMSTLDPVDLVFARVYGHTNQSSLGGGSFGGDSEQFGNLTQGVVQLWELLKTYLGLAESQLDTAAFTSLQSSVSDELGFAVPRLADDNFPPFREMVGDLARSLLLKIFIDDDGKFSIVQTGPQGSSEKSIADDEILKGTFSYSIDYKDVRSDIIVEYDGSEVSAQNQPVSELSAKSVRGTSTTATSLHLVSKQRTIKSLHLIESEAQVLANRLAYATGDRRGLLEWQTKNRFFDTELNDVITTSRTRMPGFEFDRTVERTRSAVVLSSSKSLDRISLSLDDQKGIEDNSGSW